MEIWYYAPAGQPRQGPVTAERIKALFLRGEIDHQTLVWCDGMFDWMPLGSLARQFGLEDAGARGAAATAQAPDSYPRPARVHARVPAVPNNLVWAIVSTLLCCWPLGVVSIIYAVRVDQRRAEGDIAGAYEAARASRLWALWSCLVTLALFVLFLMLGVLDALV